MSAESVSEDAVEDGQETVDADVVRDLVTQNNRLQDRVDALEDRIDKKSDVTETRIAMAKLASAVTGRDIPASNDMVQSSRVVLDEFQELRDRIDELESFVDSYGLEKPRDQDEAWVRIVDAARNKRNNPEHTIQDSNEVSLFIDTIETATGYSDRYCSDLIEKYGDAKRGARWVDYEPASAVNNHSATRKQLVIGLDVWGAEE